jgi:hypothetical protein
MKEDSVTGTDDPAPKSKLGKHPLKLICPGFHRAGSASLAVALNQLSFGPCFHFVTGDPKSRAAGCDWFVEQRILHRLSLDDRTVDFDDFFAITGSATIMDAPIALNGVWRHIFRHYPDAKVILSVRPFDSWYPSICHLLQLLYSRTSRLAALSNKWHDLQLNYHCHTAYDLPWMLDSRNKAEVKRLYYDQHIADVRAAIPAEQLLLFDVRDGWAPLCRFLDVPVPKDEQFPHVNTSAQINSSGMKYFRAMIVNHALSRPDVVAAALAVLVLLVALVLNYFC